MEINMYALAISGSPRKGGNTELLLKEALTGLKAANTEIFKHQCQKTGLTCPAFF